VGIDRISHWLGIAANLGVIAGIVFLVFEIRQDRDIATTQIRLDVSAVWRSIDEKRQEESFAQVYEKSILRPTELSLREIIQLDAYYMGVIDQMLNSVQTSATGLSRMQLHDAAAEVAHVYFSNEYAQAWWQQTSQDSPGLEFKEIMDEAVGAVSDQRNQKFYEGIQRRLAKHSETGSN
jgi:hypothetical protein